MAVLDLLGAMVVGGVVVAGLMWLYTNVTFKRQPEPYTYLKDKDGNEYVKDNTDK